jgi:hypothetical protein
MNKSKNKPVREALIEEFGEKCMYHEGIRDVRPPSTSKKRYKGKKIQDQLTLHHLKPLRENGPTTEENGSILCRFCHDYVESRSKEEREQINDELREYKRTHSKECTVEYVDNLDLDFEVKAFTFTPEDLEPKKKYNRAKDKRENEKIIKEWEEKQR